MASQDHFYIAWDGREYAGIPPEGWFLAADNRWWPPREMIDDNNDGLIEPVESPTTDDSAEQVWQNRPPSAADPAAAQPTNDRSADPPADWAPTPTSGPPEEPQRPGQWTRSSGGQRQGRRGKQNKFRLGPVLFFLFILFRCGVIDRPVDAPPSNPVDEIGFVEASAEDFTGTESCSRTFLSGSIKNENNTTQTFVVTTARQDGNPNYQSDELLIEAGETRNWVIDLTGDDRSGDFCPPVVVWVWL